MDDQQGLGEAMRLSGIEDRAKQRVDLLHRELTDLAAEVADLRRAIADDAEILAAVRRNVTELNLWRARISGPEVDGA